MSFLRTYRFSIIWAFIILVLSVIPSTEFPEWKIFSFDTAAHVIVYLILSFLMLLARKSQGQMLNAVVIITLLSISYGGIIELIQHYLISGRVGDWLDFIANAAGALLGIVVMKLYSARSPKT